MAIRKGSKRAFLVKKVHGRIYNNFNQGDGIDCFQIDTEEGGYHAIRATDVEKVVDGELVILKCLARHKRFPHPRLWEIVDD